jgi:hypothetical protein
LGCDRVICGSLELAIESKGRYQNEHLASARVFSRDGIQVEREDTEERKVAA